jgi:hypothetical protein
VSAHTRYAEPFFWWGPGWSTPAPRGIGELLRDGTIDVWTAAQLWAALARRRSVAVIAEPGGAGKTTLLTALLAFLPAATSRIYLRGCYETFAFLTDPEVAPDETALLINEISPHLPVYLWGTAVARALEAGRRGFTLLATAHAATIPAFVGSLTGSPLRIPAAQVAVFEFVVTLAPSLQASSGHVVTGLWRLQATPAGVAVEAAPPREPPARAVPAATGTGALWFPARELFDRVECMTDLMERRLSALPVVPSPRPNEMPVP